MSDFDQLGAFFNRTQSFTIRTVRYDIHVVPAPTPGRWEITDIGIHWVDLKLAERFVPWSAILEIVQP